MKYSLAKIKDKDTFENNKGRYLMKEYDMQSKLI